MNLNRTTRIGLFFLAVAVIFAALWGLSRMIFASFNSSNTTIAEAPRDATPTAQPVAQVASTTVYVARTDIPERSIITADMFRPAQVSGDGAGYVTNLQDQAVGYITRNPIPRGNRLRPAYLVGHITDVGIAGAVRPGLRAMIVPIPNKPTLHDLVKVGDYVDIVGSFDGQESRTIVQNVRVLAVDVFGKDFPQVKVAQRGDFKADPSGISEANPPSPVSAPPAGAPANASPANGQPEQPTPAPTATPTPPPAGPVAKPEAALTLELSPQQAVTLSLAQASNAPLDYVLRPHELGLFAGGVAAGNGTQISEPEVRSASILKAQLAPGAERIKRQKETPSRSSQGGDNGGGSLRNTPNLPNNVGVGGTSLPPQNPNGLTPVVPVPVPTARPVPTPLPPTYDIPVYGDGKLVRTDTVRNPAASATAAAPATAR